MTVSATQNGISVGLARILEYESTLLDAAVGLLLEETGLNPAPGDPVLVKPNLVSKTKASLSCTHPRVVRAACAWLLDHGARVTVADSPAFGSAKSVARAAGYDSALEPLGLAVRTLSDPVPVELSFGVQIGVSRLAMEAGTILNLPRLKAHSQMRVTGAVKNLFGCVSGARKALAHARWGDEGNTFETMILDVMAALPPTYSLLDAVHAMHITGPIGGEAFPLSVLAAAPSPVAVDTFACHLLGLKSADVPLWREAQARGLEGTAPGRLAYPLEQPNQFDATGFIVPRELTPVTFHPIRLVRGRLKSLLARFG